jgi:hypothetical protein
MDKAQPDADYEAVLGEHVMHAIARDDRQHAGGLLHGRTVFSVTLTDSLHRTCPAVRAGSAFADEPLRRLLSLGAAAHLPIIDVCGVARWSS